MIDRLFVYGTLRTGDVRWGFLEPFVVDDGRDDGVRGWLYDTGLGYPAAIFDGSGHPDAPTSESAAVPAGGSTNRPVTPATEPSIIRGTTFTLLETSTPRALEVLDVEEETVEGLYRRVAVTTEGGVRAWAYEYGAGLDLTWIASGDWFEWRNR